MKSSTNRECKFQQLIIECIKLFNLVVLLLYICIHTMFTTYFHFQPHHGPCPLNPAPCPSPRPPASPQSLPRPPCTPGAASWECHPRPPSKPTPSSLSPPSPHPRHHPVPTSPRRRLQHCPLSRCLLCCRRRHHHPHPLPINNEGRCGESLGFFDVWCLVW